MFRIRTLLAIIGLLAFVGSSSQAQGVVSSGWGYGFGSPGFAGPGYGSYGYGGGAFGGYPSYGYPAPYYPASYYPAYGPYGYLSPPPMTGNAMGPLMQSIRRTTGRRGGW
jgi:hypothetical protein